MEARRREHLEGPGEEEDNWCQMRAAYALVPPWTSERPCWIPADDGKDSQEVEGPQMIDPYKVEPPEDRVPGNRVRVPKRQGSQVTIEDTVFRKYCAQRQGSQKVGPSGGLRGK